MEAYSTLTSLVLNEIKSSPVLIKDLNALVRKMRLGQVKYNDVIKFTDKLGIETSKNIKKLIEDGSTLKLDEFATDFIAPIYSSLQNTTLDVAKNVQQSLNRKNGIDFNAADIPADESRIQHIVGRYREAESFDSVSFLLGDDVIQNITRSAVNDTMRGNADLQERAGFEVMLIRSDNGGCCEWCSSMVGEYKKGEEPPDFWKIHKNCTCSFEYKSSFSGNSRITFSTDSEGKITKNTT